MAYRDSPLPAFPVGNNNKDTCKLFARRQVGKLERLPVNFKDLLDENSDVYAALL